MAPRPWNARLSDDQRVAISARYAGGERPSHLATEYAVSRQTINNIVRSAGHPYRGTRMIEKGCARCDGIFEVAVSVADKRSYCSAECRNAASSARQRLEGPTLESGYRHIAVPAGHVSRTAARQSPHRIAEHTAVAETALGRPLRRGEVVHHINGDKLDNRPSNLLVCTQSYHALLHAKMSYLYQREHFAEVA